MLQVIETPSCLPGAPGSLPERRASLTDVSRPSIEAPREAPALDLEIAIDDLAFTAVAGFRRHPHINNVLTHISGASRERVEQALRVILDPHAVNRDPTPLARNLVDLMCADRGVTGRILKPYFRAFLVAVLSPRLAARLTGHVTSLFLEFEAQDRRPADAVPENALAPSFGGESN